MNSLSDIQIKDYKVLALCLTYNHSKYISDTLNGFAMQQTNFPFVCVVADDASTDGEQDVIRNWLDKECDMSNSKCFDLDLAEIIIVPHSSNANCSFAVYFLKRNLYNDKKLKYELGQIWLQHTEYIALCEGDDYWIEPEKLQLQSDCLDKHLEIDMCAHNYLTNNAYTSELAPVKKLSRHNSIIPVKKVILEDGGIFATSCIFYRVSIERTIPLFREYYNYDYSRYIHGAIRGGVYYSTKVMSVYRISVPNSWCSIFLENYEFKQNHFYKQFQMLDILDKEYDFRFHHYICARKLLNSVLIKNSQKTNISILINNISGFWKLSIKRRVSILCKCFFPRFGSVIICFYQKIGQTINSR